MKRPVSVFILICLSLWGLRVNAQSFIWIPIQINVTDGHNSKVLTIGYDTLATAGRDGYDLIDTTLAPPGAFDAYLINGNIIYNRDIRKLDGQTKLFTIKYAAEDGYGPVKLSWDPKTLPEKGTFALIDTVAADTVMIDMRNHTMYDTSVSTSASNEVVIMSTVPLTTERYSPETRDTIPDFTLHENTVSDVWDCRNIISDMDNEHLTYALSTSDSTVAVPYLVGKKFYVRAMSAGLATITLSGSDGSGGTASMSFDVNVITSVDTLGWFTRLVIDNQMPLFIGEYPNATNGYDTLLDRKAGGRQLPLDARIVQPDGDAYIEDFRAMDGTPESFMIGYKPDSDFMLTWNPDELPGNYGFILTDTSSDSKYSSKFWLNMRSTSHLYINHASVLRGGFRIHVEGPVTGNHPPALVKSIPDQELMQNHARIYLNLTDYFYDPDGDSLVYSVTSKNNSAVVPRITGLSGNKLELYPASPGTASIAVQAMDDYGAKTNTSFNVRVLKDTTAIVSPFSSWSFWIAVTDSVHSDTLLVGQTDSTTNGFDKGIDERAPDLHGDTTGFYAYIYSTSGDDLVKDFRSNAGYYSTWHLRFHPSEGHHITLFWQHERNEYAMLYLLGDGSDAPVYTELTDHYSITDTTVTGIDLIYVVYVDPVSKDWQGIPGKTRLKQNYPNPFNPTTNIEYALSKSVHVQLRVYNMLGQLVATLVDQKQAGGNHHVTFDASRLSSGLYIYRLTAGNFIQTKKMILLK